jgi:hypothetical protein
VLLREIRDALQKQKWEFCRTNSNTVVLPTTSLHINFVAGTASCLPAHIS